jgi:hypothetical protein
MVQGSFGAPAGGFTIQDNTAGASRLSIDSSGNVGIGTTSPSYKLSVNSSNGINSYDGVSGKGRFVLGDPSDPTGYVGMYRSVASTIGTAGNDLTIGCLSAIAFTTGGTSFSTQTERMRIDSSGNLLLGTTTSPAGSKELVLGGDYIEGVVAIGTVGATHTITLANGTVQTATLTSATACTFTMPTAIAGKSFILLLKQPAAAPGTATTATFTGVKWPAAGAPTITATVGRMDILTFVADGTNWYGSYAQGYTP